MRAVGLAFAAVLLVGWVYLQPFGLPWTETFAEQLTRDGGIAAGTEGRSRADVANQLRGAFSYQQYPYPPGFDVYLWLRHARNYLRHGTTCDAVRHGVCRDTLAVAPVGGEMRYARSLHIAAIVLVHRVWSLVGDPPLIASALLVPVGAAMLGVLLVFAVQRRLSGDVGAFFGAMVTVLTPHVLVRSVGGDNDVWNLVLPLAVLWALVLALAGAGTRRALTFGVVAGGLTVLHAVTWNGWIFGFAIVAFGGVAGVVLEAIANRRSPSGPGAGRPVVVLVAFVVVSVLGAMLIGKGAGLHDLVGMVTRTIVPAAVEGPNPIGEWPSNFDIVSELQRPPLRVTIAKLGGMVMVWAGLVGLVVLCLPTGAWRWWHRAVLVGGALLYAGLVYSPDGPARIVIFLLAVPPTLALGIGAVEGSTYRGGRVARAILVAWLVASLYQASAGLRFIFLAAVPLGVGVGALVGAMHAVGARGLPRTRWSEAVAFAVLLALLLLPIGNARYTLARTVGFMNDAWWEVLTEVRDRTPPEAIVNAWWDYGHWIKYVAERRVSVDGSTLRTHVPHWMARALLAETERETIGLLRMLNCGSDATPEPEGRLGAWGKLVGYGVEASRAHALVIDLAGQDRPSAAAALAAAGLDALARVDVLQSTHCDPPPSYLLVNSTEAFLPALGFLGGWDLRRAFVAASPETPTGGLVDRLGYDIETARAVQETARRYAASGDLEMFVAPPVEYLHGGWLACAAPDADGRILCPIAAPVGADLFLEAFLYVPGDPTASRLHFRQRDPAGVVEAAYGEPGIVMQVASTGLAEHVIAKATHPEVGVLVDAEHGAILVAPPTLLRATLTHLVFLEGRYLRWLHPFTGRQSVLGERIGVWRVAYPH